MSFDPADIEKVKEANDIVEVIGQSLALKKRGKSHTALCPFHKESSPSFTVSASRQTYHCFGCGVHGDVITWLTEQQGMSFVDAVQSLAKRASITLKEVGRDAHQQQQHDDVYRMNLRAAEEYSQNLKADSGKAALQYLLNKRGISQESIDKFMLGWSTNRLTIIDREAQISAGLLTHKEDEDDVRPFFFNRVMFPIRNRKGHVMGFGGRTMGDGLPKYLNTGETRLFDKSQALYGIHEANASIRKSDHILVVEGYLDTVMLHQHGITNTVAACGTAITEQHIQAILSMAKKCTFAMDGDKAGKMAARRAIEKLLPLIEDHHQVEFMIFPQGEDPDSFIKQHGKEGFDALLKTCRPLSSVILRWFTPTSNSTLEDKVRMSLDAQTLLNQISKAKRLRALLRSSIEEALGLSLDLPKETGQESQTKAPGTPIKSEGAKPAKRVAQRPSTPSPGPQITQQVVAPTLKMLLAFPGTASLLPEALSSMPLISAALQAIEHARPAGDLNAVVSHTQYDATLHQVIKDVIQGAQDRRALSSSEESARQDAITVFESAANRLARIKLLVGE